jgi:hypothetical protein
MIFLYLLMAELCCLPFMMILRSTRGPRGFVLLWFVSSLLSTIVHMVRYLGGWGECYGVGIGGIQEEVQAVGVGREFWNRLLGFCFC